MYVDPIRLVTIAGFGSSPWKQDNHGALPVELALREASVQPNGSAPHFFVAGQILAAMLASKDEIKGRGGPGGPASRLGVDP